MRGALDAPLITASATSAWTSLQLAVDRIGDNRPSSPKEAAFFRRIVWLSSGDCKGRCRSVGVNFFFFFFFAVIDEKNLKILRICNMSVPAEYVVYYCR